MQLVCSYEFNYQVIQYAWFVSNKLKFKERAVGINESMGKD